MTGDAEVVFFLQGAHGVTARYAIQHMRQRGAKVGLVRLKTIRPYPTDRVNDVLSRFAVVGVIETNMGLGSVSSGGCCTPKSARRSTRVRSGRWSFRSWPGWAARRSC